MAEKEVEDPKARIDALLVAAGAAFHRRFLEAIEAIRTKHTLKQLEELLQRGMFDEALAVALLEGAAHLGAGYPRSFMLSADDTAAFLSRSLEVIVNFDSTNPRAVAAMQENQLRMVREFTQGQRLATMTAMTEGIAQGLNPKQQAILFRQSIGLTQSQVEAVLNYKRLLESQSLEALSRELRDARFDQTVRRAFGQGKALTQSQIDRMVERYYQRSVALRAETIARTEALSAVHTGVHEMYLQAVDGGLIEGDELTRTWLTSGLKNRRDSHIAMEGQERGLTDAFVSGLGNTLMHPGDMSAPAEDVANCVCTVTTRFTVDVGEPAAEVAEATS